MRAWYDVTPEWRPHQAVSARYHPGVARCALLCVPVTDHCWPSLSAHSNSGSLTLHMSTRHEPRSLSHLVSQWYCCGNNVIYVTRESDNILCVTHCDCEGGAFVVNNHGCECRRNVWAAPFSAEIAQSFLPLLPGTCFLQNVSVLGGLQVSRGVVQVQADNKRLPDKENQGELWRTISKVSRS